MKTVTIISLQNDTATNSKYYLLSLYIIEMNIVLDFFYNDRKISFYDNYVIAERFMLNNVIIITNYIQSSVHPHYICTLGLVIVKVDDFIFGKP